MCKPKKSVTVKKTRKACQISHKRCPIFPFPPREGLTGWASGLQFGTSPRDPTAPLPKGARVSWEPGEGGEGGQGTPTPARQPWQHRSEPGTARDPLTAASLGCLRLPFLRKQTWEMAVRGLIRIIRRVCCRYDMRCWSRASLNWVPSPLTKTASRMRAQRSAGASAIEVSASPLLCPPVPAVPADPTLLSLLPFLENCQPAPWG